MVAAQSYTSPAVYYVHDRRQGLGGIFSTPTTTTPTTTPGGGGGGGGVTTTPTTTTPTTTGNGNTSPTTTEPTSGGQSTPITTSVGSTPTTTSRGATATQTITSLGSGGGGSIVTATSTINGVGTVVVVQATSSGAPTSSAAGGNGSSSSSSSNAGLIGGVVGGVVGGLALLTALIVLIIVWKRRASRTGSGYLLCFGTRPNKNSKDFDVDWPTFDPTVGAAGVGGTLGSRSGRGYGRNAQGGTLPDIDDGEAFEQDDDMRQLGSSGNGSYKNYYAGNPYSPRTVAGSMSAYNGRSDEGHLRGAGWAASSIGGAAAASGDHHHKGVDDVPTYDHLDPPEVREARAREQAEAHAQAMAAYGGGVGGGIGQSSPPLRQQSPPVYYANSPPHSPTMNMTQRPMSDHRYSTGPAANRYDDDDEASGTLQPGQGPMLHLHNPDA